MMRRVPASRHPAEPQPVTSHWTRWLRFNLVGAGGAFVQLLAIALLVNQAGAHYTLATPVGIGLAIVHNFFWHRAWTWRDRLLGRGVAATAAAFTRFAGVNGLVSLGAQTLVVAVLVEGAGMSPTVSAAVAIVSSSLANYGLAATVAFPRSGAAGASRPAVTGTPQGRVTASS